ncbi:mucin-3A-like [Erythrolamprus reginae]|uniref:mucin-3A-like n=1 Tax=Erythrolamprus reginae TaxID=121349 RepID=UPI00396C6A7C
MRLPAWLIELAVVVRRARGESLWEQGCLLRRAKNEMRLGSRCCGEPAMLGSRRCHGTEEPQPADLPFTPPILCPLPDSVRVAKRPKWPILFTILFLFVTTAASKEDKHFLNSVSATSWPSGNVTTISAEKPTNPGHTQWVQLTTDLSFSRLINQTGVSQRNAGKTRTSLSQHLDSFSDDGKRTRRSYSTPSSFKSVSTSLQDMVSSTGSETSGTVEGRSVFLPSRSEGTSQSSGASKFFSSRSDNVLGPTSIPSQMASSRKTTIDQAPTYNEHYDASQLAATNPPADVIIPVTQHLSSIWVSATHPVETNTRVPMPTSVISEETTGVSTRQQVEPLSLSWSSRGPISGRIEPRELFPPSTSMAGPHLENSTAPHPYEENAPASPSIHKFITVVTSSTQRSTADFILQASQRLEVSFTTPLTNSSPPGSSELSLDVANNESDRMVPGSPDTIPMSVAETSRHKVSLGVTQLAFASATVGLLKEANPTLEPRSSLSKEHIESFPTTSPFGTSKGDEVSLASRNMLTISLVEAIKLEPKDNTVSIVEGYIDPTVSTISKGETDATSVGVNVLNHQTSSPLTTLLSGNAKTGPWVSFQTDLLESTNHATDYRSPLETHGTKRPTSESMKEIPTSKSPLTATEPDPVRKLTNVQPVDTLPKRGTGATPSSPLSSTTPASKMWQTSKDSSEPQTVTDLLVTKVFSLGTTKTDSAVPSLPYLDIGDVLHPIGATSTRLTYTDLSEGHSISAAVESFGSPSVEQKFSSLSQSHPTVSLPDLIEIDRSLIMPFHRSLSSIPFSRTSVAKLTSKMFINVTEGHLARREQMRPRGTKSFGATPLSLESRNTVGGIAPSLPTKVPTVGLRTSSEMATLKDTGTSTADNIQTTRRTTLPVRSSRFTTSSNFGIPAYPSFLENKSNQATAIFSATTTLGASQRTLPVESKTTCRNISCPGSIFTPPPSISTQSMTSQPLLGRKFLSPILGTTEPKKNMTLADAKVSRSEERDTTTIPRTKIVTQVQSDHSSQQPKSKFTTLPLDPSAKENLTLGKLASTLPPVRVLSLWFRLIKIDYTVSLMNKSSESYKKLEREIKLILKKMLSTYENFLYAKVLRFLRGSLMVESQLVFQATGFLPTLSDILRTIVTEIKIKRTDDFFNWKIDLRSLNLNGIKLKNLEPEKLPVFFTLLEQGSLSAFGDENFVQKHLESVKIKMKLLLATQYDVHLISLVDNRTTQGGIVINGNLFINTEIHVDVDWILKALIGLSNISVDLSSLSINGSKLSLQVFPVSFLITNRIFNEKMLDRSSEERQDFAKDLSDTLMRILGKYENLLQVAIRNITGGSLVCYGDVIFQQPAPSNKDVLQTLAVSVDPKNYLDSSSFQVDRFSFTVAGAGLEPYSKKTGVPLYAVIIIILILFVVIAVPTFLWLPKVLARRGKIRINRESFSGVDIEAFELDNPGYQANVEEAKIKDSCFGHQNA